MLNRPATSLLPWMILLTGCPIYGSEPVDRGVQVSCVDDFDCPLDSFCDVETRGCLPYELGVCLSDGDCPVGSYCDASDGGCYIPPIAECRVDRDCNSGFECDFRDSCRPETFGSCLTDQDCAIGELCVDNLCTAASETCRFDFQCAAGFSCANNRCRLLCSPSTKCPSGTRCEENLCQPALGECLDSSECPDLATNCVESLCLRRCDEGCDGATEVCDDRGFCRPRSLPDPNAPTPFCRSDADCSGSICVEGVCRTECDVSAAAPDDFCASFDGQLPLCGADNLCYGRSEMLSDCREQRDCAVGQSCIDGRCR